MSATRRPWFHPKRYCFGWGLPATWQGWLTLAVFMLAIFAAQPMIRVPFGDKAYSVAVGLLAVALIAICWWSSGPPRGKWRGQG